ncbi:TonB-dependent receptor [Azohydromonas caseinilytica]|uniref:TonB-dependent receptor n=1 Tax=Azohydromonas caseinilytica TaxID=2728836 RepID=A0A848FAA8_9BURK|nr:TonB-dependent receptor [Azohydromonas caseinilytica]NML15685.1 TonB-dependent receptor [Azohydromonas caseinilytica]
MFHSIHRGWLMPWLLLPALAAAQESPRDEAVEARVEVIGASPLPGQAVDRDALPYATQSANRARLDEAQADNLADFMSRRMAGVQRNDIQGNPFQGDLTYRGFRASPLLGAGQGVSVFLDGIRVNEAFGDVVSWDLLPEFAVNTATLVPGANPAFGLNSLGGALSFTTHSGFTAPGLRAEVLGGSHGRQRVDGSWGGSNDAGWHGYAAATGFDERGWRDHSGSTLGQFFGKLGRSQGEHSWDASLLLARSRLVGNGLVPAYTLDEDAGRSPDLYAARRASIYTHPDITRNRLAQLGLHYNRQLGTHTELEALLYLRRSTRDTTTGDVAEDAEGALNAALNTSATRQRGWGGALGLSGRRGAHQWQLGLQLDASRTRYRQREQEAFFTADRGTAPGDEAPELAAAVEGSATAVGLYAADTWRLASRTHVTATLRYNRARVANTLTTVDDDSDAAKAQPREVFTYQSVNPALGLTHRLEGGPTLFANLARNNRVPTVIELGCADPANPCRLPAGLQSDPYLKQVVSRTVEAGLRWPLRPRTRLTLAAYRTINRDDILFSSVSATSQLGYFRNFERTRHQGLDAELQHAQGPVTVTLGYSFLDATYQADGLLRSGPRNVAVTPGTRIAALPRHTLKLGVDWRAQPALTLGADLQASSRRVTAGNEDGRISDGGAVADLSLPGHAVLNLRLNWRGAQAGDDTPGWELMARVNNVLDRRYENFATLGASVFDAQGRYTGNEQAAVFVAPGAPRTAYLGLRLRY